MILLALGDTHGRTAWKTIVSSHQFDKVVFIGDYFDTHDDVSAEQQLSNFEEIIRFKKENSDKVILLLGNHDYHYLRTADETYSGFQKEHKTAIQELIHPALDDGLLQLCFVFDQFLFSHAGVTRTWLKSVGYPKKIPVDVFINDLFVHNPLAFNFTPGRNNSPFGDDISQTPIWIRPESLERDAIDGFTQIVGHTPQKRIKPTNKIILIDALGTSGEYVSITDGEIAVEKAAR